LAGLALLAFDAFWYDSTVGSWFFWEAQWYWLLRGAVVAQGVLLVAIGLYWVVRDLRALFGRRRPYRRHKHYTLL
jgi:hypothetical protein